MILVDANLLIYAFVAESPRHEQARDWLDEQLSGRRGVGLPWESLLAFVRIVTHPKIAERPVPLGEAWQQVENWLSADPAWTPTATERHAEVLASLMSEVTRSNLLPDAHLAALALEHGLIVASADGDFARFPGVRWVNPLADDRS